MSPPQTVNINGQSLTIHDIPQRPHSRSLVRPRRRRSQYHGGCFAAPDTHRQPRYRETKSMADDTRMADLGAKSLT